MSDEPAEAVAAAVAEVRREARRAALVTAAVDGVAATLVADAVLLVLSVPGTATRLLGPATAGDGVALLAGLAVGAAQFAYQRRGDPIERFEAGNPEVRTALRTARDTVERHDASLDSPVVRGLHEEVLERLRTTSSVELLPWRRLAVVVVLAVAVSVGSVGLARQPVGDGGPPAVGEAGPAGPQGGLATPTSGLRAGDAVLGEPTNVTAGDENLTAGVRSGPGARGDRVSAYDRSGFDGDAGGVDARRAGYDDPEPVEEADLIREYTLALGEDEDD